MSSKIGTYFKFGTLIKSGLLYICCKTNNDILVQYYIKK